MLAVVVTCWVGARPIYQSWHVLNVREMFRRHLTVPHRFVCLTDDVERMHWETGIDSIELPRPTRPEPEATRQHWLTNYGRLAILGEFGATLGDRVLGVDLDIVVRANINSLVDTAAPVKFMCLDSRTWIQGGLILATPGAIDPDPWTSYNESDVIELARDRGYCGSDQAVLSYLFYDDVRAGAFPHWSERDGVSVNDFDQPDWRIFFRTGDRKCWDEGQPERDAYYENCGADPATCPERPRPPLSGKTPGGTTSRVARYCKLPGRPAR